MDTESKMILAGLIAVTVIALCVLGGCLGERYFALEAAKVGLESEGPTGQVRYVPTKEF